MNKLYDTLLIFLGIFILLTLMLTVFATQADFTDVSVLPVIVSRLQEEQVEVSIFGCPDKNTNR